MGFWSLHWKAGQTICSVLSLKMLRHEYDNKVILIQSIKKQFLKLFTPTSYSIIHNLYPHFIKFHLSWFSNFFFANLLNPMWHQKEKIWKGICNWSILVLKSTNFTTGLVELLPRILSSNIFYEVRIFFLISQEKLKHWIQKPFNWKVKEEIG